MLRLSWRRAIRATLHRRHYYELPADCHGCMIFEKTHECVNDAPLHRKNRAMHAALARFVDAYRTHGHMHASIDPLRRNCRRSRRHVELDPEFYGLSAEEVFPSLAGIVDVHAPETGKSLAEVHAFLQQTYAGNTGYEFMHARSREERAWFARAVETHGGARCTSWDAHRALDLMVRSETLDLFLARRFPSVKRYGLEGGETLLVALDALVGVQPAAPSAVLCMPHRGRLNVLVCLLGMAARQVFAKIGGAREYPKTQEHVCTGDVLSHLACSVDLPSGAHVSLLHNPSHLEAVNPVAQGKARAKQLSSGRDALCLQIHGDAAFCAQGIVMESFAMANLAHYTVGGSIHIVLNNQIGFTTPPSHGRSSEYCTDLAKMNACPVIHVNADCPQSVYDAAKLAAAYRNEFHKDVVLDLVAYRRWGHNEVDEPSFTQPSMYAAIRARGPPIQRFAAEFKSEHVEKLRSEFQAHLESEMVESKVFEASVTDSFASRWATCSSVSEASLAGVETVIDEQILRREGERSVAVPENGFEVHPRLMKHHVEPRLARLASGENLDWATCEALAFGTLLHEGFDVRISGQDVGRGTFSQRHAMLVDQGSGRACVPLNSGWEQGRGKLEVANSPLSELGVLGFEYGHSLETPNTLVLWEAQFGDFANAAQVVFDAFIASSEAKWQRQTGLVMLLPHGYDGAGPEHSSARLERILQQSNDAADLAEAGAGVRPANLFVAYPTTPAQYFHLLRRQMHAPFRRPLVVVAPKTLLRLPAATSALKLLAHGSFQPVICSGTDVKEAETVVLCTGKLYYELAAATVGRRVLLVRLEQLAPFPHEEITTLLRTQTMGDVIWCQEEPRNFGAYSFVAPRIQRILDKASASRTRLRYVGRAPSAAVATGSARDHKAEHEKLLAAAFEVGNRSDVCV